MFTNKQSKNSMNICLVDFRLTGHHPFYLANFAHIFLELSCEVDIFTSNPDLCEKLIGEALPELNIGKIRFVKTNASNVNKQRKFGCRTYFTLLELQREITSQELVKNAGYDLIYFAYLDDIAHLDFRLPYLFKPPFSSRFTGLLMAPREKLLSRKSFASRLLLTSVLQQQKINTHEIGLLVEDVTPEIKKLTRKEVIVYPDFCSYTPNILTVSPLITELKQRKKDRTTVSLLGSIQPHKSVDIFLDCIEKASSEKYFFVIAGKFNRSAFDENEWRKIQKTISNPPENLLVHDSWLQSEEIFDSIVQLSNFLFAYYRNFRKSSNILTKGAFYSVPVLVSDEYLMGRRVSEFKLGYALTESQVSAFFDEHQDDIFVFDEALRQDFVERHSTNRLKDILSRSVRLTTVNS